MECRIGCGACCIAPSISTPMPGQPLGKPAGIRCVHLSPANACQLWNKPERPLVCQQFQAEHAVCGDNRTEALQRISLLEMQT